MRFLNLQVHTKIGVNLIAFLFNRSLLCIVHVYTISLTLDLIIPVSSQRAFVHFHFSWECFNKISLIYSYIKQHFIYITSFTNHYVTSPPRPPPVIIILVNVTKNLMFRVPHWVLSNVRKLLHESPNGLLYKIHLDIEPLCSSSKLATFRQFRHRVRPLWSPRYFPGSR